MRTSPRSGSVWHQHPKAFALNNICKMKGRSSAKLKVCFSPFYKRCKGFTLLLVLQEFALSNGDKLPDMRRWFSHSRCSCSTARRTCEISVCFHMRQVLQTECLRYIQSTRLFVYMCACSINNPSDTCVVLGLLVFRVVRLRRGICVLLRLPLLSFYSVNHRVQTTRNESQIL